RFRRPRLNIDSDHRQAFLLRLVHNTGTDTNFVHADDPRAGSILANVANRLRRRGMLPRLQGMHKPPRNDATHTLRITIASNVNPGDFASIWSHIMPPLLRRLYPRQGNERIITCRRGFSQHLRIPKRTVFAPLDPTLFYPLPGNKAGNDLATFLHIRRIKGAGGVRRKHWVGEVAVKVRPCLWRLPDLQNPSAFRSHQGRMHALMNRRVDLSRLVHDDENAP